MEPAGDVVGLPEGTRLAVEAYLIQLLGVLLEADAASVSLAIKEGEETIGGFAFESDESRPLVIWRRKADGHLVLARDLPSLLKNASGMVILCKRAVKAETLAAATEGGSAENTTSSSGASIVASRVHVVFTWRQDEDEDQDDAEVLKAACLAQSISLGRLVRRWNKKNSLEELEERMRELETALESAARKEGGLGLPPEPRLALPGFNEADGEKGVIAAFDGDNKKAADEAAQCAARWAQAARTLAAVADQAQQLKQDNFLEMVQLDTHEIKSPQYYFSGLEREVELWKLYESHLKNAIAFRHAPEAKTCIAMLQRAKRFVAAAQLDDGVAALSKATEIATDAARLLNDLPRSELQQASTLDLLCTAVRTSFQHLAKLRASRHYPATRAARLIELLSAATASKCSLLLSERLSALLKTGVMKSDSEILTSIDEAETCLAAARSGVRRLRELAADLARVGNVSLATSFKSLHLKHEDLEARLNQLRQLITQKQELSLAALKAALEVEALDTAYAKVLRSPTLLNDAWSKVSAPFEAAVQDCEQRAAVTLEARLEAANSADDAFGVFADFRSLLEHGPVRRAAQRHQASLVARVQADVELVKEACTKRFEGSRAEAVQRARGLLPSLENGSTKSGVAAKILWAKQMEWRLETQLDRLYHVLGSKQTAERHPAAKKLTTMADELRRHLDARPVFQEWLEIWRRDCALPEDPSMLCVSTSLHLVANVDRSRVALATEIRHLRWLGFRVPETLALVADDAAKRYPTAVALQAAMSAYAMTRDKASTIILHDEPLRARELVKPWLDAVRERVTLAFPRRVNSALRPAKLDWTSPPAAVRNWVDGLAEDVHALQTKLDLLAHLALGLDKSLADLIPEKPLLQTHALIQDTIDKLSLEGFQGLDALAKRLQDIALKNIRASLAITSDAWRSTSNHTLHFLPDDPLGVRIDPPFSAARRKWLSELSAIIAPAAQLPKLRATRFDALESNASETSNQSYGVALITSASPLDEALARGVEAVETAITQGQIRLDEWRRHLLVWRLPVPELAVNLDRDSATKDENYINTLVEALRLDKSKSSLMKSLPAAHIIESWWECYEAAQSQRASVDVQFAAEEERRELARRGFEGTAVIVLDCSAAADRIRSRFDAWLREFGREMARRIQQAGISLQDICRTARDALEAVNERRCPCRQALAATAACGLLSSRFLPSWQALLLGLEKAETALASLLETDETVSDDWREISRVRDAVEELDQLVDRKQTALKARDRELRGDLETELRSASIRTQAIAERWRQHRPERYTAGGVGRAIEAIEAFSTELEKTMRDIEGLDRAATALRISGESKEVSPASHILAELERLASKEVPALAEVWSTVRPGDDFVQLFDGTRWHAFDPNTLKIQMRDTREQLATAPSRIRQYTVYTDVLELINTRETALSVLSDVKLGPPMSETVFTASVAKPLLMHKKNGTRKVWDANTQTLGELVSACQDASVRSAIDTALASARADAALSEFLDELATHWQERRLDVTTDHKDMALVTGLDVLFAKLDDDASALRAMRDAPHFKRAINSGNVDISKRRDLLEKQCDDLRQLLELWADGQRRYVHLAAIFGGGNKSLGERLPVAAAKFHDAARLFSKARRDVLSSSDTIQVLDLLRAPGLADTLSTLAGLLAEAQHALGMHLEEVRSHFPRLFFVGDEDLLAVLAAADDNVAQRVSPHLSKMFQALDAFDENKLFRSVDGETVRLDLVEEKIEARPDDDEAIVWLRNVESVMHQALTRDLIEALATFPAVEFDADWLSERTTQTAILAAQVMWAREVEAWLGRGSKDNAADVTSVVLGRLETVTQAIVSSPSTGLVRKKRIQLVLELAQQRDATMMLPSSSPRGAKDFEWLRQFRAYASEKPSTDVIGDATLVDAASSKSIACGRLLDAAMCYGFEYQGVGDRLVRTPLTDRCFLTLAQALRLRLGASPVGPAGTGKTQSVRALGALLGRHVIVFCCDEAFNFISMGRLLRGLCHAGTWGVFDEFNRLESNMLSAISEQIRAIQLALTNRATTVDLGVLDTSTRGHSTEVPLALTTAVFVTMNPGYAGRSPLPENLKQLFRTVAMVRPDSRAIARVALYARGFADKHAAKLSGALVALFEACDDRLSKQSHYDWGLRALTPVLERAGTLKRRGLGARSAIAQALSATVAPKLVDGDARSFEALADACLAVLDVDDASSEASSNQDTTTRLDALCDHVDDETLRKALQESYIRLFTSTTSQIDHDMLSASERWLDKATQLRSVLALAMGVVVVGTAGVGKTLLWRGVLAALEALDSTPGCAYVIDPKALCAKNYKELLFGRLDPTTLEWTDGVVTGIVRAIDANERGEATKRHWLVFDGSIDASWAENLNSVLDDNRTLTLPNGERLAIPANVRFVFEVDDLSKATPATVSRCGVLHLDEAVVSLEDRLKVAWVSLREDSNMFAEAVAPLFVPGAAVHTALSWVLTEASGDAIAAVAGAAQPLASIVALCRTAATEAKTSIHSEQEKFARRACLCAVFWACAGPCSETGRIDLAGRLAECARSTNDMPSRLASDQALCYDIRASPDAAAAADAFWQPWESIVSSTPRVDGPKALDTVVPTADTVRHEALVDALASTQASVDGTEVVRQRSKEDGVVATLLCGPPGSGKTMVCAHALARRADRYAMVALACSSGTSPNDVAQLLGEHCELSRSPGPASSYGGGVATEFALVPKASLYGLSRTLVLFCDELNLVGPDSYGTPRALALVRQLIERGGFWALSTQSARAALEPASFARSAGSRLTSMPKWIRLERIAVVGACNPPTDAGRQPLPPRLSRHLCVVRVGTPSRASLARVYRAYVDFALRPALIDQRISVVQPHVVTEAMLDVYERNAERFGDRIDAPQCVYSARDLTRWCRALRAALDEANATSLDAIIGDAISFGTEKKKRRLSMDGAITRLWAHEGLRLFSDRLERREDQDWCARTLEQVIEARFPKDALCGGASLAQPLLYSRWLSRSYAPARLSDLKSFIASRLRAFYEEELDVPLVVFDDVIDHVLRIDSVLRSESGHLLLVGESGVGKSILTKFVAWNNGLTLHEVQATRTYTLAHFDEDLKRLMTRAGVEQQKVCLILDEADAVSSAFLERMNALLASGEIPGLWSADDLAKLLVACREARRGSSQSLNGAEEDDDDAVVLDWFAKCVRNNLHVVFTLNPGKEGLGQQRATASPALFNRCVVDWFGAWSQPALAQVADALAKNVDFDAMGADEWDHRLQTSEPRKRKHALALLESTVSVLQQSSSQDEDEDDDDEQVIENEWTLRHAVVSAMVQIHSFAADALDATARDFVELAQRWVSTSEHKRKAEETSQRRKMAGLREMARARASVATMQDELAQQNKLLEEQDAIAKERLERMVADQREAETKQRDGERLSAVLEKDKKEIETRKHEAETELAKAEPALEAARSAVRGITRRELDEVRSLRNPPLPVRRTLETVEIILGALAPSSSYTAPSWEEVRKLTRRGDFIATVVDFAPSQLDNKAATFVKDRYLSPSDATLRELTKAAQRADPDAKPVEALEKEAVFKASKACGPLMEWAVSQIEYAEIERKVEPLREEVIQLERDQAETRVKVDTLNAELEELAKSVASYKEEYAVAVRNAERIKADMEQGKSKADRADRLLASLGDEQARWDDEAKNFTERMCLVVPDALRSAVVIAYAGKLAEKDRVRLSQRVDHVLCELALSPESQQGTDCNFVANYLCSASTIREWHEEFGLPRDDRYLTNAAIFTTTERCALLIDPSGAATRFVEAMLGTRQAVNTATAGETNFEKTLATAARFGGALIVNDVDDVWDSVAHPLLNREFVRRGGRSGGAMVKLGAMDAVEVSPDFRLVLHARDARAARELPLGLLGRVCLLDFSTTLDGLEQTVLTRILRVERPELESQRTEAQRTVDEQKARLEALEDEVLQRIAGVDEDESDEEEATPASILDDDKALRALENTKIEAKSLREQAERGAVALAELRAATRVYASAARCCAKTYGLVSRLPQVHTAYEYSLEYFLDSILTPALCDVKSDESDVLSRLCEPILYHVSRRVGRGLLRPEHRVAAAVSAARLLVEARDKSILSMCDAALNVAFTGKSSTHSSDTKMKDAAAKIATGLSELLGASEVEHRTQALEGLLSAGVLPETVVDDIESWCMLGKTAEPEVEAFGLLSMKITDKAVAAARAAAFIKAVRPERLLLAAIQFARVVLGDSATDAWLGEASSSSVEAAAMDASVMVARREKASRGKHHDAYDLLALEADGDAILTPTILVVVEPGSGRDGSADVENLAASRGYHIESVAMGAPESQIRADAALRRCSERGHWLLLCNAHLAGADWLESLERRLRALAASVSNVGSESAKQCFILFLSAEAVIDTDLSVINSWRLPRALTARSETIALGAAQGVRAGLLRHLDLIESRGSESWTLPPAERVRVYALLGWAHAVATERVRYSRGWSKSYEWGDVDALCALAQVDASLAPLQKMAHVDPSTELAWDAIRGAFIATYGSRLEVSADFRALGALAETLLVSDAYEHGWTPVSGQKAWPEGAFFSPESWREWIEDLSPSNDCSWLGLAPEADAARAADRLTELCRVTACLAFSDQVVIPPKVSHQDIAEAVGETKINGQELTFVGDHVIAALKHEARGILSNGIVRLGAMTWSKRFLNAARLDTAKHLTVAVDDLRLALLPDIQNDSIIIDGLFVRGASWQDNALSLEPGQADYTGAISLPPLKLAWQQKKTLSEESHLIRLPLTIGTMLLHSEVALPRHKSYSTTDDSFFYLRNVTIEARS